MTNLQEVKLFKFEEMNIEINAQNIEGIPYFVGNEIAQVLGYKDYRGAVSKKVDEEDKLRSQIYYKGQNREVTLINENGVKTLCANSRLPNSTELSKVLGINKYSHKLLTKQSSFELLLDKALKHQLSISSLQWNYLHSTSSNKTYEESLYYLREYQVGKYRVDLYFPEFNLIVEYDEKHHENLNNKIKDIEREEAIKQYLDYDYSSGIEDDSIIQFVRVKEGYELEGIVEIISHLLHCC